MSGLHNGSELVVLEEMVVQYFAEYDAEHCRGRQLVFCKRIDTVVEPMNVRED